MTNASTVLPADDKQQISSTLEQNAEVMSNTKLDSLLATEPQNIKDEVIRINTEARPRALQFALLVPILASTVGLINSFRMKKLPDPKANASAEGVLGG
jgi:hypothetical protein